MSDKEKDLDDLQQEEGAPSDKEGEDFEGILDKTIGPVDEDIRSDIEEQDINDSKSPKNINYYLLQVEQVVKHKKETFGPGFPEVFFSANDYKKSDDDLPLFIEGENMNDNTFYWHNSNDHLRQKKKMPAVKEIKKIEEHVTYIFDSGFQGAFFFINDYKIGMRSDEDRKFLESLKKMLENGELEEIHNDLSKSSNHHFYHFVHKENIEEEDFDGRGEIFEDDNDEPSKNSNDHLEHEENTEEEDFDDWGEIFEDDNDEPSKNSNDHLEHEENTEEEDFDDWGEIFEDDNDEPSKNSNDHLEHEENTEEEDFDDWGEIFEDDNDEPSKNSNDHLEHEENTEEEDFDDWGEIFEDDNDEPSKNSNDHLEHEENTEEQDFDDSKSPKNINDYLLQVEQVVKYKKETFGPEYRSADNDYKKADDDLPLFIEGENMNDNTFYWHNSNDHLRQKKKMPAVKEIKKIEEYVTYIFDSGFQGAFFFANDYKKDMRSEEEIEQNIAEYIKEIFAEDDEQEDIRSDIEYEEEDLTWMYEAENPDIDLKDFRISRNDKLWIEEEMEEGWFDYPSDVHEDFNSELSENSNDHLEHEENTKEQDFDDSKSPKNINDYLLQVEQVVKYKKETFGPEYRSADNDYKKADDDLPCFIEGENMNDNTFYWHNSNDHLRQKKKMLTVKEIEKIDEYITDIFDSDYLGRDRFFASNARQLDYYIDMRSERERNLVEFMKEMDMMEMGILYQEDIRSDIEDQNEEIRSDIEYEEETLASIYEAEHPDEDGQDFIVSSNDHLWVKVEEDCEWFRDIDDDPEDINNELPENSNDHLRREENMTPEEKQILEWLKDENFDPLRSEKERLANYGHRIDLDDYQAFLMDGDRDDNEPSKNSNDHLEHEENTEEEDFDDWGEIFEDDNNEPSKNSNDRLRREENMTPEEKQILEWLKDENFDPLRSEKERLANYEYRIDLDDYQAFLMDGDRDDNEFSENSNDHLKEEENILADEEREL